MSSAVLRQAARSVQALRSSRTLASSAVARKDFVQDLYIKELKAYKAPPVAKDAHVGVVKSFAQPPAPQAPAIPSDLASELSAYDAAEPTKADAKPVAATSSTDGAGAGAEAFLAFLEADPVKHDHAHH
ncbi:hypothetical protein PUNSTDRAFT_137272 [Punctularia strigosozonata HHB-11173 SS5]|uniref:uncharacterized protein n=1 Tax=Punctularia strigosozonata (strain HHB-11173) TaxID=741275 RepID=UPI0004416D69|nr:uncharacterized protein PUNSTDRAFT_137272 [Punctularia strigosozonata HHB-11173 SS5]EIN05781.1 hypothetical protein PUNSTDRAFT_137272 [Punctularia strigosozonata HHB-11173 SS5]